MEGMTHFPQGEMLYPAEPVWGKQESWFYTDADIMPDKKKNYLRDRSFIIGGGGGDTGSKLREIP